MLSRPNRQHCRLLYHRCWSLWMHQNLKLDRSLLPVKANASRSASCGEVNNRFQPNEILVLADGGPGQAYFTQKIEFFKDVHPVDDKATAYVCQNVRLPVTHQSPGRSVHPA